jgi:hypothetical protein
MSDSASSFLDGEYKNCFNINFEIGKIYFFHQSIGTGYAPLTYQQAMESIQNCTYRELDTSQPAVNIDPQLYTKMVENYHKEVMQNPDLFKDVLEYRGY